MPQPVLRLHLLAVNAAEDLEVRVDDQIHRLAAGDPAVVHELTVPPGSHEVTVQGRVRLGRTGRAAAAVELLESGVVDVYYALPAVPGMRGEIGAEPDVVPGREWRVTLPSVLALVGAVWIFWFVWYFFLRG